MPLKKPDVIALSMLTILNNMTELNHFTSREIEINCADGRCLRATLYEPHHDRHHVVQINSALGVPRRFYQRLAQHLTGLGCVVITFDYRGVGDSQDRPLRRDKSQFRDWGELDIAAVIAFIAEQFPQHRHSGIGHSAGGALLGLAENSDRLQAFLSIASPSAYWRNWSFPHNIYLMPFWHLLIPVLPRTFGYFPGELFGMGKLPKQVVLQWRRWAMHQDYIVDDLGRALRQHYHRVKAPMRFVHLSDDKLYAPRPSIEHLADFYAHAKREIVSYSPQQCQQKQLGHFGYFRPTALPLWQHDLPWLLG